MQQAEPDHAKGEAAQSGRPYTHLGYNRFLDPEGYPAVKPPWGTLNAIDLDRGEIRWSVPLGEFPELTKRGLPLTGTENYGGPVVTAGGISRLAGTGAKVVSPGAIQRSRITAPPPRS